MGHNDRHKGSRMLYNIVIGNLKNILNVENEGKEVSNKLKGLLPETLIRDICFKTDSGLIYDKKCYLIIGFDLRLNFVFIENMYSYIDSFNDLYPKTIINHSIIEFMKKNPCNKLLLVDEETTRKEFKCIICSKDHIPETFKMCAYCCENMPFYIRECPPYEGDYCEELEGILGMRERDVLCKHCLQKYIKEE